MSKLLFIESLLVHTMSYHLLITSNNGQTAKLLPSTWHCVCTCHWTVSCIAPRCTGMCGALATSPPSGPNNAQEKSSRSWDKVIILYTRSDAPKPSKVYTISIHFTRGLPNVSNQTLTNSLGCRCGCVNAAKLHAHKWKWPNKLIGCSVSDIIRSGWYVWECTPTASLSVHIIRTTLTTIKRTLMFVDMAVLWSTL